MRIDEFCDIRLGHSFRGRLSHVAQGNVFVIQPKNILADGSVSFAGEQPLRTDVANAKPLQPEDVLVVNRGRFAAAVFNQTEPQTWIVPSSVLVLSLRGPSLLPEYLTYYLNSANGQRLFLRHCEQTTIPFIGAGNIGSMSIPVPSLERQRALVVCGRAVARYSRLADRKRELLGQLMDHELGLHERHIEKRSK